MSAQSAPLLIAAVAGRMLAASAVRAGRAVVVADCFADRDTRTLARDCRSVALGGRPRLGARALLAAAAALAPPGRCEGLVYGAGFEGRTTLLARLAAGRRLFGNPPSVVAAVRDPGRFFPLLDDLGIRHPEVRLAPPRSPSGWLVKRPGGAGGSQVRYAGRRRAAHGSYFQRLESGRRLSALFLADRRRACVLGFNEQWAAPPRRGLHFRYGGAVGGIPLPFRVEADLRARLDALVAATGLVGLNGIDFLLGERDWLVLEVNPRPTATMELYDPDYEESLFEWHLRACDGRLPERAAAPRAIRAQAVVYASSHGRWRGPLRQADWCRDIPQAGTRYTPGQPLCTIHAAADTAAQALELLAARRSLVERAMGAVTA
jgi:predicted ATP-grasp superfamily ATP-dependent carboligase